MIEWATGIWSGNTPLFYGPYKDITFPDEPGFVYERTRMEFNYSGGAAIWLAATGLISERTIRYSFNRGYGGTDSKIIKFYVTVIGTWK